MEIRERLNATRSHLLSVLDGLSDDHINWKPDDSTWSIAQVVEHIAIVEGASSHAIALGLAQEPSFVPQEIPLEKVFLDRSKKVNSPDRLHPSAEPKTKAQLEETLHISRDKLLSALNNVVENIAVLNQTSPPIAHPVFVQMSTEQWITSVRLHEERHIEQIEEVRDRIQSR